MYFDGLCGKKQPERWTMSKLLNLNITIHNPHNPLKLDAIYWLYWDVHIVIKHKFHLVVRQFFTMLMNSEF